MSKIHPSLKTVMKVLGPIIQERIDKDAKYGSDWEGRPVSLWPSRNQQLRSIASLV